MKLVIDIDENIYQTIVHTDEYSFVTLSMEGLRRLDGAIRNGTPLPKRHGNLKDADRLLDGFFYEYCKYGDFGYRQAEDLIKSSLTIIEADKEG